MRVVFFGTPEFAVPSLAALMDADVDVVAAVTRPDRPAGRSHSRLVAPPVKRAALTAGIPVWQPDQPGDPGFLEQLRYARADLGIVVAYGHLLRSELLAIPRLGLVNVHASLLPRWRGAAPIQWALLSGDTETGVSVMRVEAGLDTGAVWQEARTPISDADTAGTLSDRLARLGGATLVETLTRIAAGEAPQPQSAVGVTHAPKVHREQARVRWHDTAAAVSCRIRAMDPAPGAWTSIGGTELKLFGAAVGTREAGAEPAPEGAILATAGRLVVATGGLGAVEIAAVQPAGRKRLSAGEWLRGAHLEAGAHFA